MYGCTIVGNTNAAPPLFPATTNSMVANCLLWSNALDVLTNLVPTQTSSNYAGDPSFYPGTYVPSSSNVVDMGNATYATVSVDFRGSNRTTGAGTDIGAFEKQDGDVPASAGGARKKFWWLFSGGVL